MWVPSVSIGCKVRFSVDLPSGECSVFNWILMDSNNTMNMQCCVKVLLVIGLYVQNKQKLLLFLVVYAEPSAWQVNSSNFWNLFGLFVWMREKRHPIIKVLALLWSSRTIASCYVMLWWVGGTLWELVGVSEKHSAVGDCLVRVLEMSWKGICICVSPNVLWWEGNQSRVSKNCKTFLCSLAMVLA